MIHVKFLAKTSPDQDPNLWLSLFPGRNSVLGDVEFHFNLDYQDYDWLVVYEGLPPLPGDKRINRIEPLACPRENTMLITTEPSSIRVDGPHFLKQFGHVLSAKNPKYLRHPHQIFETPPLRWFYGRPLSEGDPYVDVDTLTATPPLNKTEGLSTVCSAKTMNHTAHAKRYDFIDGLKQVLGDDLTWFGRGIRPISDKAEAMDPFRYHIAIENHVEDHHWTEKISDCFLAYCLPFYYGAPNIFEYFPEGSVVPIDINDVKSSADIIRQTIQNGEYEKRLSVIIRARNLVLSKYNLMTRISEIVTDKHISKPPTPDTKIYGRHIFRKKHPIKASLDGLHRTKYEAGSPIT